jgi:hypothetical protein
LKVYSTTSGRLLVDELGELEIVQHPVQIVVRLTADCARDAQIELDPNHRDCLQQLFLIRRQPVNARSEDPLYGMRNT